MLLTCHVVGLEREALIPGYLVQRTTWSWQRHSNLNLNTNAPATEYARTQEHTEINSWVQSLIRYTLEIKTQMVCIACLCSLVCCSLFCRYFLFCFVFVLWKNETKSSVGFMVNLENSFTDPSSMHRIPSTWRERGSQEADIRCFLCKV